jgi:hypothetical protein
MYVSLNFLWGENGRIKTFPKISSCGIFIGMSVLENNDQEWLSREQAARRLGVTGRTIYNWHKAGLIRHTDKYGRRRYLADDLDQLQVNKARLPLTSYKPHNTFVVWIKFSSEACGNWKDIQSWCDGMKRPIDEFVLKENLRNKLKAEFYYPEHRITGGTGPHSDKV